MSCFSTEDWHCDSVDARQEDARTQESNDLPALLARDYMGNWIGNGAAHRRAEFAAHAFASHRTSFKTAKRDASEASAQDYTLVHLPSQCRKSLP